MEDMSEYRIMHAVECLSAGVAHSITTIISGYCDQVPAYVVHGPREFIEGQFLNEPGVTLIPWKVDREISPSKDIYALIQLVKIIRKIRPTLIHAHSTKAGAIARIAAFITRTPCLYTPHSYSFLRADVPQTIKFTYKLIEYMLAPLATTVACGLEEFQYAKRIDRKATLVENGVDVSRFDYKRADLQNTLSVVAVGRITPQKDFPFFLKVAELLPDVHFKWITGEDDFPKPHLENLSIYGRLSPQDVSRKLNQSSIFINTSEWEGLSRAALEAASCGLPLVLRRAPGNRELGFRLPKAYLIDTPEAAASDILRIQRELELDPAFGLENRTACLQYYDAEKTQSRIKSIYDGIFFGNLLQEENRMKS